MINVRVFFVSFVIVSLLLSGAYALQLIISSDSTDTNRLTRTSNFTMLAFNTTSTSPIIYLPFDVNSTTNVYDHANISRIYSYQGDAYYNSSGVYGGSASFDGLSTTLDYINVTPLLNTALLNQSFTISIWASNRGNGASPGDIILGSDSGATIGGATNYGVLLMVSNAGSIQFGVTNGSGSFHLQTAGSGNPFQQPNVWNHIIAVYNHTTPSMRVYRNAIGEAANTTGPPYGGVTFPNKSFTLGTAELQAARLWNGTLDEFMFFDRVLSDDEVSAIYANQSSRYQVSGTITYVNLNLSGVGNENRANVSVPHISPASFSNLSVQIGLPSGGSYSYAATTYQVNPITGNATAVLINGNPNNVSLRITFNPGSSAFLTPLLLPGNITLSSYEVPQQNGTYLNFTNPTPTSGINQSSNTSRFFSLFINTTDDISPRSNLTFKLYNSTSGIVNWTSFNDATTSINFTGLTYGVYFYEVEALLGDSTTLSTEQRNITFLRPLYLNLANATADFFEKINNGEVAEFLIIGDSITYRNNSAGYYLRDYLEQSFGYGGDGYRAFHPFMDYEQSISLRPGFEFTEKNGAYVNQSGSSNEQDIPQGLYSYDGIYTEIGHTGTVQLGVYGSNVTVVYVKKNNSGMLNITDIGGEIAFLNASSSTPTSTELTNYTFSTGTTNDTQLYRFNLSVVGGSALDPKWVQINGMYLESHNGGVRYSRLARGGCDPTCFLMANETMARQTLRLIDPDLIFYIVDPNDAYDSEYDANATRHIDIINESLPNAEIILVTHHHFNNSDAEQRIEGQAAYMINMSLARGYGFINWYDIISEAEIVANDYLDDDIHFSREGGMFFGNYTFDLLMDFYVNDSENESESEEVQAESSDSGGGGFWFTRPSVGPSLEDSESISATLGVRERQFFAVDSVGHHVGVLEINATGALIEIASTPMRNWFAVGDSRLYELTNDSEYDVRITLHSISNLRANISIDYVSLPAAQPGTSQPNVPPFVLYGKDIAKNTFLMWTLIVVAFLIICKIVQTVFLRSKHYHKKV